MTACGNNMHPNDPKPEPATDRQRLAASPAARDQVRLERTKEFETVGSDGKDDPPVIIRNCTITGRSSAGIKIPMTSDNEAQVTPTEADADRLLEKYRVLVDRLNADVSDLRTQLLDARSGWDEARGECERLRAEIERWRDSNIRLRDELEKQAARANAAEWGRDADKTVNAAQLAELTAISVALGTNEGHSSVDHIERLKAERDALAAEKLTHA